MRGGSLWLLAFLGGCGFSAVPNDNNLINSDLNGADFSGVDFAGVDLASPPGSDLAVADLTSKPPCVGPLLLITIENLHNPSTGGGRVHVLQLGDGTNLPTDCTTLAAQGLMTPQPFSAAMVAGKLAVFGRDALQLIDPASDLTLWSKPVTGQDVPVDVFALKHPDGRDVVAAGFGSTGTSFPYPIGRVDGYGIDSTLIKSWRLNAVDLPLGLGIQGMSSHPKSPTHFFALDPSNNELGWDVNPWSATKTGAFGGASGNFVSIYSATWMTLMRTVWVDTTSPTRIYYNNDNVSGALGPINCSTGCTFLHAVPNPTLNTRFFGLCEGPGVDGRHVVRFSSTSSTCDNLLDGARFGAESRLSRLAVAQ